VFVRVDTPAANPVKQTAAAHRERAVLDRTHPQRSPVKRALGGDIRLTRSAYVRIDFKSGLTALYRTSDLARIDAGGDILSVTFVPPPVGLVLLGHVDHRLSALGWDGVTLTEFPGNFRPGFRSVGFSIPSAKRNTSNCRRGSRPGLANSSIMSWSVGRPTPSVAFSTRTA
jgi:hypothetical protein